MQGLGYSLNALTPTAPSSLSVSPDSKTPNPAKDFTSKNDNVADNIASVVNQNSPLMQQARTAGLRAANRRGVLNSSMAVGAAQDAVIGQAAAIGGQQAQQNFSANQAFADYDYRGELQGRDFDFREASQERDIDYRKEAQAADIKNRLDLQRRDLNFREDAQDKDIALQEAANTSRGVVDMERLYQNTVTNINNNTNLSSSARSSQLRAARNLRSRQLGLVEQINRVNLRW